jgi:hypothetical protein
LGLPARTATAMKFPAALAAGNASDADDVMPASLSTCCTSAMLPDAAVTVHVNVWLDDNDPSEAVAVTLNVPADVGTFPDIRPVELLIDSPVGRPEAE